MYIHISTYCIHNEILVSFIIILCTTVMLMFIMDSTMHTLKFENIRSMVCMYVTLSHLRSINRANT